MITKYYRPRNLEEALRLLANPENRPLGGGTTINLPSTDAINVVDLQSLDLNRIHKSGEKLLIGATVTLQSLLENVHISAALKTCIRLEAPLNLRYMKTVAGTLVTSDGRSTVSVALMAMDAKLLLVSTIPPSSSTINEPLGNILPLRPDLFQNKLITCIEIPLNIGLAFESVTRTPMDKPIICAALAKWPSGRTRLVLGGWGKSPILALDGNDENGIESSAENAAENAGDEWAGSEYRREVSSVLAKRCLDRLKQAERPN